MKRVKIYIEGGGDQKDIRVHLRKAFGNFLSELRAIARQNGVKEYNIVACGGRQAAFDDFCVAMRQNPDDLNVLLVDAEAPYTHSLDDVWAHLNARDAWNKPPNATPNQCFLMVQCMEAWLVADKANLKRYFGKDFVAAQIPQNHHVETIGKNELYTGLRDATGKRKSPYHKTRDGFALLETTDPKIVRQAAPHCKRMFQVLASELGGRID